MAWSAVTWLREIRGVRRTETLTSPHNVTNIMSECPSLHSATYDLSLEVNITNRPVEHDSAIIHTLLVLYRFLLHH